MNSESEITFYSIFEYIKDNFIGLLMLIFAFIIIYIVDRINYFNASNITSVLPMNLPTMINSQLPIKNSKKVIGKKNKKN